MTANQALQLQATVEDYFRFLAEYRLDEQWVRTLTENLSDQAPMPPGFDRLRLQTSPIEGEGMFATVLISGGELLAPARISGKRTPAGRFTNHSPYPNAKFVAMPNGDLDMFSLHAIAAGDEVTIDYRQAVSVNGWRPVPDRREVIKTLHVRLERLGASLTPSGVETLAERLLQNFGYLPSFEAIIRFGCLLLD